MTKYELLRAGLTSALAIGLTWGCGSSTHTVVREDGPPDELGERPPEALDATIAAFLAHDANGSWDDGACDEMAARFRSASTATNAEGHAADALYMAGMVRHRCGDRNAAAAAYREALLADEGHCRARVGLGLAELARGRSDLAEGAFQTAIDNDNRCSDAYLEIARLERQRGELDEALENLRRALAVDSGYVEALHEMALVHLDRAVDDVRALPLAEVVCEQARQADPSYAPLYNTWGVINVQQGRIVDALARFERAFTLDPTLYEAWMNFGQITLSFRGYEDARRAFAAAVGLNSQSYDALIGLGVSLRGLGHIDEAAARYEEARALDPNRPEAWFNLGILHEAHRSGSPEELARALSDLETFLSKADGQAGYEEEVREVSRCCADENGNARACRPGRLQNLRSALRAMGRSPTGC